MNSRKNIMLFLKQLEIKFPNIETWKVDDIHVWPYLRNKLYFSLVSELEKSKRMANEKKNKQLKKKHFFLIKGHAILEILKSLNFLFFFIRLKQKKYVFFEAYTHRVFYNGVSYNKFYDTFINECNLHKNTYVFDYLPCFNYLRLENSKIRYDINKQVLYFINLKRLFFKKEYQIRNNTFIDYELFVDELKKNELAGSIIADFSEDKIKYSMSKIIERSEFFLKLFKKIKPKEVFILCYYNNFDTYSIVLSANRLNIKITELQHGPQTSIQSPYAMWDNIPKEGYFLLPNNYWNWDFESNQTIKNWTSKNSFYDSYVGGNPWVDFLRQKKSDFSYSGYVLYTLQSLSFDLLFANSVIKTIIESNYLWMIRLHPRQMNQRDKLIKFLKEKGIYNKVNVNLGTDTPLPILMKHALVNITHYSGTVNEAVQMNKKSILLDEMGVECFSEFIEQGKAFYIPLKYFSLSFLNRVIDSAKGDYQELKVLEPFYRNYFK